jgi:hypothetical protein
MRVCGVVTLSAKTVVDGSPTTPTNPTTPETPTEPTKITPAPDVTDGTPAGSLTKTAGYVEMPTDSSYRRVSRPPFE